MNKFSIDSGMTNSDKKSQNLSDGDDFVVDRISYLPDSILSYILSFLPTKPVVATSILSKRWRFAWTYVDKLDFDYLHIDVISIVKIRNYFTPFVYRVLKLHQGNIKELRISCSNDECEELDVTNWINTAIDRGVERLSVSTYFVGFKWPISIFTCKSLVELNIDSCDIRNMNFPSAPFFPCLKKLYIQYLKCDTESLKHFVLQCPALEHFELQPRTNIKVIPIEIVSSTMKRLDLTCLHDGFDEKIYLSVPSLEHLQLWYILPPELSMEEKLASLVEGDISFVDFSFIKVDLKQLRESFVRFIQHFANVKILRLRCHLIKFLTSVGHAQFPNLTKLAILSSYFEWRLLVSFMESSINLEAITLKKTSELKEHKLAWKEPKNVPLCLSSSLRKITIDGYSKDQWRI